MPQRRSHVPQQRPGAAKINKYIFFKAINNKSLSNNNNKINKPLAKNYQIKKSKYTNYQYQE